MNVLLTGATGFVGRCVLDHMLHDRSISASTAGRRANDVRVAKHTVIADIGPSTDWRAALEGVDAIVHTAARVHVMRETEPDADAAFRRVNIEGTINLARQAANAGVRRLVFVSSIKVNGEHTTLGHPFRPDDEPAPLDAYGRSKLEAERALRGVERSTGMEVVVVRCPLVYGPNVGANFRAMMGWLDKGLPLPFGNVQNSRSLVGVDNLVSFLLTCARHPNAAGETFLVSDGEDLSTTQLLERLAAALGRAPRLLPVPVAILRASAALTGKRHLFVRLCGSLQVDISKALSLLEWRPPVGVDEGFRRTAEHYLRERAA